MPVLVGDLADQSGDRLGALLERVTEAAGVGTQPAAQGALALAEVAGRVLFADAELLQGGLGGLFGHRAGLAHGAVELVAECLVEWLHAAVLVYPFQRFPCECVSICT
ncbi:hypothetical protein [Halomonas sp. NO4]|uniref:hypothetical protein n=1 Tax=Halomonas sp. NO4 TaxID=2484813 RepID=UPI00196A1700|nr:hypothetical protein [Halomonas sp. NO4]